MKPQIDNAIAVLALGFATLLATGCQVDTHKDGDHENVKIATPFGGMSVRTDGHEVQEGIGLTAYPGAVLVKKDQDHDNGSANVSMNFGNFHLGVKAVSYQTGDAPDKVTAFYRKDLARYGAVILCRNDRPVGSPTVTGEGLRCDDDEHHNTGNSHSDKDEDQLKAGSKRHQHIVAISPREGGTHIGLVALELPGHVDFDHDDADKSDRQ